MYIITDKKTAFYIWWCHGPLSCYVFDLGNLDVRRTCAKIKLERFGTSKKTRKPPKNFQGILPWIIVSP